MRMLGVTYKTAWFMTHRIREVMRTGGLGPSGGSGKTVEVDETYIGRLDSEVKERKARGFAHKNVVLTLVERGGGARSFISTPLESRRLRPLPTPTSRAKLRSWPTKAGSISKLGVSQLRMKPSITARTNTFATT